MKCLLLTGLLLLTSCATKSYYVSVEKEVPPSLDMKKFKTIAIEPLEGDRKKAFSTALNQRLIATKKFKVLSRDNVVPIVRERVFSDMQNQKTSKMKTADLVIQGSIDETLNEYTEWREAQCFEGPCKKLYFFYNAISKGNLKIVDAKTSEVLYSSEVMGHGSNELGKGNYMLISTDSPNINSFQEELKKKARDEAITQFLASMVVSKEKIKVTLFEKLNYIKLGDANSSFRYGYYDDAIKKYEEIIKKEDNANDEMAYAYMGLALTKGYGKKQFDEAITLAQKAKEYEKNDEFDEEIEKLKKAKDDLLKAQKFKI